MTWSWSKSGTDHQVNTRIDQLIDFFFVVSASRACFIYFFPTDVSPPSIFHIPADHEPDKQLTDWLKEQGADADTVDKVEHLLAFEHLSTTALSTFI